MERIFCKLSRAAGQDPGIIVTGTAGRLEVIATPIGNLGDLSPRAVEALQRAALIVAEDTRRTGQLLAHCGISRPLQSLHEHNEAERAAGVVGRLRAGDTVALVSDAGTPLLSDPGLLLVRAAAAAGIPVVAIPGPSALTAALSIAGLSARRFAFEGFLPARGGERRAALGRLAAETRTLVFFEAPHRLAETLADMNTAFGADRHGVIARELTKMHETVYRGTLAELAAQLDADANIARGELVLMVEGAAARAAEGDMDLLQRALPLLLRELPPARAAGVAAKLAGVPRETAYGEALRLSGNAR
jgi:16S rRNA (cytidine1402-2'-O)-methyltransferase